MGLVVSYIDLTARRSGADAGISLTCHWWPKMRDGDVGIVPAFHVAVPGLLGNH